MYYLVGMKWGNGGAGRGKRRCGGPRRLYQTAQGERLNQVLDNAGIDAVVEAQCASCDADGLGRRTAGASRGHP